MNTASQTILFEEEITSTEPSVEVRARAVKKADASSTTFVDNMRLPVHRWFRYSAGFSADWARNTIQTARAKRSEITVLDPFVGSGTTLLAAQVAGARSFGVEAHPFIARVARTKLLWGTDPALFRAHADSVMGLAQSESPSLDGYPSMIRAAFGDVALADLDRLRRALARRHDDSPAAELTWLALVSILRASSHVGTAQWQYVLPNKRKLRVSEPLTAFAAQVDLMMTDMRTCPTDSPSPILIQADARTCAGVPDQSIDLVVTSPPYANNYDYADATRLEMSFLGEITGYSDLQKAVREYLVRSCSQHVTEKTVNLDAVLADPLLAPIGAEIAEVCQMLGDARKDHGGKKNYHLMVATYFLDMAKVWHALRRVCRADAEVLFVVGDSAPYGVYVPVLKWNGALAQAAGFSPYVFEKTRDRNIKWKNRKHRVPLVEGRFTVRG